MKQIILELSPESCKAARDVLKPYTKGVDKKLDLVCEKLVTIGLEEARARFAAGNPPGNDSSDLTVTPEPIENGFKIVASGHDVGFIEFGAGWTAGQGHPYASEVSFPVYPGSYSEQNTKEYSTYGSWHYKGISMTHLTPQMPMYHAVQRMREEMPKIIREVFGE